MLTILMVSCWVATASAIQRNLELELRNYLLGSYTPTHQPQPVEVNVGFEVVHLGLDQSVLDVSGWLWLTWKDPHFVWNCEDFGGLGHIHLSQQDIWIPQLELAGNADKTFNIGQSRLAVNSSGHVTWMPSARLRAYCQVDLWLWPVDAQNCRLSFATQNKIELKEKTDVIGFASRAVHNSEWDLLYMGIEPTETMSHKYNHDHSPGAIETLHRIQSGVSFSFILKRSSPTHKATLLIPAIVIVVSVISSFLLPPGDAGKISLSTINFLAICLTVIHLLHIVPQILQPSCSLTQNSLLLCHIPAIILFYSGVGILSVVSVLLHVYTRRLVAGPHHKPPKIYAILSGVVAKLLCLSTPPCPTSSPRLVLIDDVADEDEGRGHWERDEEESPRMELIVKKQWMVVAQAIDRILFLLYVILFSVVTKMYTFP